MADSRGDFWPRVAVVSCYFAGGVAGLVAGGVVAGVAGAAGVTDVVGAAGLTGAVDAAGLAGVDGAFIFSCVTGFNVVCFVDSDLVSMVLGFVVALEAGLTVLDWQPSTATNDTRANINIFFMIQFPFEAIASQRRRQWVLVGTFRPASLNSDPDGNHSSAATVPIAR
jgi:hypothetical protein